MSVFEQQLQQLEQELNEIDRLIHVDWVDIQEGLDCFVSDIDYSDQSVMLKQYIAEIQLYKQIYEQEWAQQPLSSGGHSWRDTFMKNYYETHPQLLDYYWQSFIPLITHIQDCARDFPRVVHMLEYGSGFVVKDVFDVFGKELPHLNFLILRLGDLNKLLKFVNKLVILYRYFYDRISRQLDRFRNWSRDIFHREVTPENILEILTENQYILFQLRYGLKEALA
jgi:hypothetical protein